MIYGILNAAFGSLEGTLTGLTDAAGPKWPDLNGQI